MTDKKMSKRIKFALIMNNSKVRTLQELRAQFSLIDIIDDFVDLSSDVENDGSSRLYEWLNDRHHHHEARAVKEKQQEWAQKESLSPQEKQNLIWEIQSIFKPSPGKMISREEIAQKYDIPTKKEFDKKSQEASNYIGESLPEDIWRKYVSRLAWNDEVLQTLIVKEKRKHVYLLGGNVKTDDQGNRQGYYHLRKDWVDIQFTVLCGKNREKAGVILTDESGTPLAKSSWEKTYRGKKNQLRIDFKSTEIYVLKDDDDDIGIVDSFISKITGNDDDDTGIVDSFISKITDNNDNERKDQYILWENPEIMKNPHNKGRLKENSQLNHLEDNSETAAKENLSRYMDAQFPLIYFKTYEEDKADEIILAAAGGKRVLEWSVEGFFEKTKKSKKCLQRDRGLYDTLHLLIRQYQSTAEANLVESHSKDELVKKIYMDSAVLVLKDVHELLKNDVITAQLKYLAQLIYKGELPDCNIIIVSPLQVIPKEIENYMTVLNFSHLSSNEIEQIIKEFSEGQKIKIEDSIIKQLKKNLKGLTEFQIVNILSLALAGDGEISEEDMPSIKEQKKQIIRKSGILEIVESKIQSSDIGGLKELTTWIEHKGKILEHLEIAHSCGVDIPKGVLIAGMPGCGKSLSAKVIANTFGNWPLLRVDMGKLMGKYVGESEENMRQALLQADAVSPCVLWIDELEKAFAGIGGDGGAAEVTTRLFGTFLTWMQEKQSPAFVVATANDISALPSELLRKGRFDEVFYIDLPNRIERSEIFRIHMNKRNHENDLNTDDYAYLAKITDGFSGADIEGVVRDSIEQTFLTYMNEHQGEPPDNIAKVHVTRDVLETIIRATNSLKKMRPDAIERLNKVYKKFKFRRASQLDD